MELSNNGTSIYHRFRGHYERDAENRLLGVTGAREGSIESSWDYISTVLARQEPLSPTRTRLAELARVSLVAYESNNSPNNVSHGICLTSDTETPFETFFADTILTQSNLLTDKTPSPSSNCTTVMTAVLTEVFDRELRNVVPNDAWENTGRKYFANRVEHFVRRDIPLEFILPAFPCKSSNGSKVAGKLPDRGEELALRRLHRFVLEVERVYQPGAKLWIVSDGHVFSDCSRSPKSRCYKE
jgi:hypothetical protein